MIKICVAVDSKMGFAKDNNIPWNIPEDFKHFMTTTANSVCISGKNSYLEMVELKKKRLKDKYDPTKPVLNNRDTYVLSSTLDPSTIKDATVIKQMSEVFERHIDDSRDIFILGGSDVFKEALQQNCVSELIITRIPGNYLCDRHLDPDLIALNHKIYKTELLPTKTHGIIDIEYYRRK